ncbi:hypothetical protein DF185_15130 [Marinifilum breve]|uniref:Outer membrane protein beta-barrel domain-containing protein n=1 Tax=Marinifilum breve TaxID=2184082 RepID=A0A2V3ZVV5_9BACT|nr:porin family protein [Marinifilum breve]PXX99207.1 hypothetical protein DF185_15130 [Marinifilum breve]
MRLIFTTICLLLLTSVASAQIEQGKFYINAQSGIGFSSVNSEFESGGSSTSEVESSQFAFAPSVGYFVGDGLLVGLSVPYMTKKNEDEDGDETKSRSISFGPFVRYYFNNGGSKTKPYLHGGLGVGASTTETDNNKWDYRLSNYELGGGLAIFFHKNIAVDLGLSYSNSTQKYKEDSDVKLKTKNLAFNVGFTFCL